MSKMAVYSRADALAMMRALDDAGIDPTDSHQVRHREWLYRIAHGFVPCSHAWRHRNDCSAPTHVEHPPLTLDLDYPPRSRPENR